MAKIVVGIDPGLNGGICCQDVASGDILRLVKIPEQNSPRELVETFRGMALFGTVALALYERVRSSPQMGVSSAFTFARGVGQIEGCLAAMDWPIEDILPQKWQKAIGCLTKGDKNISKAKAMALFPKTKVFHWNADAILICEMARRTYLERHRTI